MLSIILQKIFFIYLTVLLCKSLIFNEISQHCFSLSEMSKSKFSAELINIESLKDRNI